MPVEFNQDATMSWKVLKFQGKKFNAIIGLNVLRAVGAIINLKEGSIEVGGKITKFLDSCPYDEIHQLDAILFDRKELFDQLKTENLNTEELQELKIILSKNKDLFFQEGQQLTSVVSIKHEIITKHSRPIYAKTYRFPKIHEEEVEKQVKEMLNQGIIKFSNSAYNSPIWVVPKKADNSGKQKWRIVVDYRKLNELTTDDKFPIPNIESMFDKLGRAQYFTTLDLAKGFHQILVDEKDRSKTAFSTPQGHYEYVRMPFGLKNAPATFQRMMNHVLRDFLNIICVVYLDDILIFSTSLQEHIDAINKIFDRLRKFNLKIQIDKCNFFARQTDYLGHTLTNEGIKPNQNKIEVIKNLHIPKTRKAIKSFLGTTGYYRKFIKDYAKIAQPLTQCLKKDNQINENDQKYTEAFEKLKSLITEHPVLRYPDFKKKFVLTTDASQYAIGAVLSQEDHPNCFASRTLNEHEIRYSTIEKELLAIIWATKYFRPYLFGQKFIIRTDHQPLVWLSSLKEPNSKLQRWKIKLNEFDYDIEYVKGKDNKVADFLSRINAKTHQINLNEIEEDQRSDMATIHSGVEDLDDHIPIAQTIINKYITQIHLVNEKNVEILIKYRRYRQIYISREDLEEEDYLNDVFRRLIKKGVTGIYSELDYPEFNKLQLKLIELFGNNKTIRFVKCSLRAKDIENEEEAVEIIEKFHKITNHRGINENYEELKNEYYYPKLRDIIHKFINNCEVCNLAKYDRHPIKEKFKLTETPSFPNEIVHGDLFYCHNKVFLTTFDKFTKHLMASKLNDRNSITIIEALKIRFSLFGKPKKLVLDNEFDNLNMRELGRSENIEIYLTSPRSHTGNSDIERTHGTLNEHLRIFEVEKLKITPEEKVLKAVEYYNNTIHSTTQVRPTDFLNNKVLDMEEIRDRVHNKKVGIINKINENRKEIEIKNQTETTVKNPKTERHKTEPRYIQIKTKMTNGKLIDDRKRKIHPSRIKRKFKFISDKNINNTSDIDNDDN